MALRWEFTRDTRFNVPYKVEIYDSQHSLGSTDLGTVSGVPVEVTMGTQHADPEEKIKGSQIIVRLWGKKGDFDDLFDRNNDRFKIKLYIDGNFDAEFIPVPDTFKDYDTPGEFTVEIKAANLALLKQKQVEGIVSDGSRLAAIEDIISVYFDTPVDDGTVFYPTEANTSGSSLLQQNIQASRLEGMNCYEALEFLLHKGMQLRMAKGKVIILPTSEASFTAYNSSGTATVYDDNFVSTKIGGRLSKTRTRLRTYDGVRRTYNPLDADNIVPSGDFEIEDFSLTSAEQSTYESNGEVESLPDGWSAVRAVGATTLASMNGADTSWKIPESIGAFAEQSTLEANGTDTHESWKATSGQVLSGERLRISFQYNYESINRFAHIPIKIRVGDQILFRGRDNSGNLVAGNPEWRTVSNGLIRHVDHVLLGTRADSGFQEWEFITPPIPTTGELSIEIETPSVDRSYSQGDASFTPSLEPNRNFLEIASLEIDPANEAGEILTSRDTLAGEDGDVYEYTEGFGDGFSSYNPGALFNPAGQVSFTPLAENLTDFWVYAGNDNNVPATELPLSELETKYLASILTKDRDRLNGTVDVYDFIALIDGYRVNYIQTDFRFGRSKIELIEIRDHDLDATIEDRKKKKDGDVNRFRLGPDFWNFNQAQKIGELNESIEETSRTEIDVALNLPMLAGFEYWIINENELSRESPLDGIYPVVPQRTDGGVVVNPDDAGYDDATKQYGPGPQIDLPIEEQLINAPKGSLIIKSPDQGAFDQHVTEQIIIATDVALLAEQGNTVASASSVLTLESTVTTQGGEIDANASAILSAEADIDNLETDTSANASSIVSLDSRVTVNEGDISTNASAILSAETRITDAENDIDANSSSILSLESETTIINADLSNAIRSTTAPTTRPSGESLQAGDAWIDTDDDDRVYTWDGTQWRVGNRLIDTNASAILSAESRITAQEGDTRAILFSGSEPTTRDSGDALETGDMWVDTSDDNRTKLWNGSAWVEGNLLINSNASAITSLDSRVTTNEGNISANASAITTAEANISDLETDSNHVFRQTAEPTQRPSGNALQEGDYWVDTDDDNRTHVYDGSNWVEVNGLMDVNASSIVSLESDVTVLNTDTRTVLRSNSAPTQRDSGEALQAGDLWVDLDNDKRVSEWTGSAWDNTDGLIETNQGDIAAANAQTVLKASASAGEITEMALVQLDADVSSGSSITLRADKVSFDTELMSVSSNVLIGQGLDAEKLNTTQVLVGMATATVPFVHVRANNNNYVEMVARESGDGNFFEVVANGNSVFSVDSSGATGIGGSTDVDLNTLTVAGTLTMGASGEITNSGGDYTIDSSGIKFDKHNSFDVNKGIRWGSMSIVGYEDTVFGAFDYLTYRSDWHRFLNKSGSDILAFDTNQLYIQVPTRLWSQTRTQILNISSPVQGMMLWNNSADRMAYYDGSDWRNISPGTLI